MYRVIAFFIAAITACLANAGCNHCGPRPCGQPNTPPGPLLTSPPVPAPQPAGAQWLPEPSGPPAPPSPVPAQSFSPSQSKSVDPSPFQKELGWKAGPSDSVPSVVESNYGPSVRLYPPEVEENPDAGKKVQVPMLDIGGPDGKPLPKVREESQSSQPPKTPVGIADFAVVQAKVATGRRPSLDDGLGWLEAHGYKTVLYIHQPGEPESADRKQIEKHGLKFVGLGISPTTLTRQMADEFNRVVADAQNGPLFVYDRDGALLGAMWYLYFKLGQQLSDENALSEARRLGLSEDRPGLHRDMWEAARRLLSEGGAQ